MFDITGMQVRPFIGVLLDGWADDYRDMVFIAFIALLVHQLTRYAAGPAVVYSYPFIAEEGTLETIRNADCAHTTTMEQTILCSC